MAAPDLRLCGTLPLPALPKVTPITTSAGVARAAVVDAGVVFTVTGHGSFQDRQVTSTWAYVLDHERILRAGEIAHEAGAALATLVPGSGAALFTSSTGLDVCKESARAALPAAGKTDRPADFFVDGGTVLAVRYETARVAGCK